MNKKILLISLVVVLVAVLGVGVYFWRQSSVERKQQADEAAVKSVVENFGKVLKNVSLLSPTASQDIETNYKDFLDPALLAQWEADPSKAVGRLTSSPWPDRIEIVSIRQFGSGAYDVSGNIIEVTSLEEVQGGIASKRTIDLGVVKFDDSWLVAGVTVGEYADNSIAAQLRECLPKSDMVSHDKCQELLNGIKNFDDCVNAGFSILKSNPAQCATPDGRTFAQETNSTWEQAILAVSNCEVEKVFQTHSRIVTLTLKNGNKLIATEPEIDDIVTISEAAESRCGKIPMATE